VRPVRVGVPDRDLRRFGTWLLLVTGGGPTAVAVDGLHGRGTMGGPPIGCQAGPGVQAGSWSAVLVAGMSSAALVPSASIVQKPGAAGVPAPVDPRTNRMRPSGVHVAPNEIPSVVSRRRSVPSGRTV
jgi:hypothetical protein